MVVIEARIGSNNPGLARTVYPVVGLYPVVKCKVVMLLVAGSSYTLKKSATKRSAAFLRPGDLDQVRACCLKLLFPIPSSFGVNPSDHSEDFISLYFLMDICEP